MGSDPDRGGFEPGPFFEGAPDPSLVIGACGRILFANAAFAEGFGWAPEAVAGRPLAELLGAEAAAAILAPPGRDAVPAEVTGPCGRGRPGRWRAAPGPGGTTLAVVRAADELVEMRRRAEVLERVTGIGVWELDPASGAVRWSPGLYAVYGADPETCDPSGIDWFEAFQGASVERFREADAALRRDGTPFDLELEMIDGRGRRIWVRATAARDEAGRYYGSLADVTEERRLRRQMKRLSTVAQMTTTGVMIQSGDGRIEWVNEALTKQVGYELHELVGQKPSILYSPNADPEVQREIMGSKAERRPIRVELVNRHRDGHDVHFSVDARPAIDEADGFEGWVSVRTDITDFRRAKEAARRAEREARESRQQLVAAVEVLDDAFVLYDASDRLVVCNERYRTLYDRSAAAMVRGARFEDILRLGLRNGQYLDAVGREEEWLAQRLADHKAADLTLEQPLAGGRWLRVVERATPDGGRVGLRVDITRMKEHEARLEEALRRAEEASAAKSSFLATMSHEIRTPMNGILGLADLLAETPLREEQGRLLGDLRGAGEMLLHILNDILDFSKIEAGQIALEEIPLDPAEIARRVEALHGPLARDKGLALRVEAPPGPLRRGDATRLLQVLGNLASNAVKFTEAGEVVLSVANPGDGALRIEVADTGIGMSPEEAARVFDRFAQADASVTRRFGGTGLGLSIVRGLVTAMGGEIDVASARGEGTRVALTLPLPVAERPRPASAPAAPVADLGGVRILAADDNAMNRRVLAGMLDRLGAAHEVVSSGAEAVEAARGGGHDLLLLDISMPGMDGIEALALIAAQAAEAGRAPPPALAVTANVMEAQVASYLAAGFHGHIAKPVRIPALAAGARAALESAAAA
jgi:PAS domain S-box-containing protein